jgi:hypothetical protein
LTLRGEGGTSINRSGNVISIASSGSGGSGIQGVQSPGSTLTISNGSGPVASIDIANGAVTGDKLADGSVSKAKLGSDVAFPPGGTAGGDLVGTYPNPQVAEGAITSSKISNRSIEGIDINRNAQLEIATLYASGSVGIGTTKQSAALEINGKQDVGLMISSGTTLFSYKELLPAVNLVIPNNVTVVRIMDDGQFFNTYFSMPLGLPGQILYIVNDDAQAASVPPAHLIMPGHVRMFMYIGDAWRPLE